jgi:ferredoxin
MPTPFGIRRRLKRLFGLDKPAETEPEIPRYTFTMLTPKGEEFSNQAQAGSTILVASGSMSRPIASGCADSTCGTCRVEVIEGVENCSPQAPREKATLKENGHPMTMRLACKTTIESGPVKVRAFEVM